MRKDKDIRQEIDKATSSKDRTRAENKLIYSVLEFPGKKVVRSGVEEFSSSRFVYKEVDEVRKGKYDQYTVTIQFVSLDFVFHKDPSVLTVFASTRSDALHGTGVLSWADGHYEQSRTNGRISVEKADGRVSRMTVNQDVDIEFSDSSSKNRSVLRIHKGSSFALPTVPTDHQKELSKPQASSSTFYQGA